MIASKKTQSKFLSLILRHEPARIGLALDANGWTDVAPLLAACTAHGVPIGRDELDELVRSSDKQRFALSPDGARIRANQGHSVEVDLALAPVAPPERLYHGTVARALDSIRASGLLKGERHHVHLSAETDTATTVGARRGKAVILTVRAGAMAAAGHAFYRSANGVWLADHVPVEFIDLPAPPPSTHRRDKLAIAKSTLAACEARAYDNAGGERVELDFDPARTELHDGRLGSRVTPPTDRGGAIALTDETTLAAIARLGEPVAVLNFASAKNPGGGFLGGAQAQEETLARSSALYPCLCAQMAYYERNRACGSAMYLDLALWSPDVPFFRDDGGGWLDAPIHASVITCPAPNAGALRQHGGLDTAALDDALRRRRARARGRDPSRRRAARARCVGRGRVRQRSGAGRRCVRRVAEGALRSGVRRGRVRDPGSRRAESPRVL